MVNEDNKVLYLGIENVQSRLFSTSDRPRLRSQWTRIVHNVFKKYGLGVINVKFYKNPFRSFCLKE